MTAELNSFFADPRRVEEVFQGDRDTIVPEEMARKLFDAASPPKTFHLIPDADHNNTYERGGEAYWQAWRDFTLNEP